MSSGMNDSNDSGGPDSRLADSMNETYNAGDGALGELHQVIDTNCAQALSYTVEAGSGMITLTDLHGSLSNALSSLNVSIKSILTSLSF